VKYFEFLVKVYSTPVPVAASLHQSKLRHMFTTHKSQDAPGPAEGAHSAARLLSWIWGGKEVGMACRGKDGTGRKEKGKDRKWREKGEEMGREGKEMRRGRKRGGRVPKYFTGTTPLEKVYLRNSWHFVNTLSTNYNNACRRRHGDIEKLPIEGRDVHANEHQ